MLHKFVLICTTRHIADRVQATLVFFLNSVMLCVRRRG